jgi:hypothetical protein
MLQQRTQNFWVQSDNDFLLRPEFCRKGRGGQGIVFVVCRLEDASLTELLDLSLELFENVKLPEGSVISFGSASFLSRVGTSIYARDWVQVVARAETTWRGICIFPLIPLILSPCPGTLAREISELAAWFASVYDGNPLGLHAAWSAVVATLERCSEGTIMLPTMDSYKIPLPTCLSPNSSVTATTFCVTSSRPVSLKGLPKDDQNELLCQLLKAIYTNFQTCDNPENFLVREPAAMVVMTEPKTAVLVGASNLSKCAIFFSQAGYNVVDPWLGGLRSKHNMLATKNRTVQVTLRQSVRL